jgi:hypothetical protein
MKKFSIEIIERGIELRNEDLFSIAGGGNCTCQCIFNAAYCVCNNKSIA